MKYTRIFYKLPDQMLKEIYYAFIHLHVLYGVEICDRPLQKQY